MIPDSASFPVCLTLLAGLFLSFFLFCLLGPLFYKKRNGESYSYLSHFPFELFDGKEDGRNNLLRVFGGGFLLFDLLSALLLLDAFFFYPHGVFYLALLASFLHLSRVVLLFFLLILPARYNKAHVMVVALYFVLASLSSAIEGIFLIRYSSGYGPSFAMAFALIGISIAFLFLMANPRFSQWARLAAEKDQSGEVIVKRPRFFLLAYSEWLGILFDVLSSLSLILAFLLLYLRK